MDTLSQKKHNTQGPKMPRYGLHAPVVELADPVDGLLTLESLQQPITAKLIVWDGALPGDTYQLIWNDVAAGVIKKIANDEGPGAPLSLDIPASLLTKDGQYKVAYRAVNVGGGQGSTSDATYIIVDRTPPGGALLAPLMFPSSAAHGLSAADLSNMGDVLVATLPGYSDAKWGDVVHSYWAGQPGPVHTVQAEQLTANAITFNFDRRFLEQLGDGEVAVTYTVTDRAGNLSVLSQPATVKLQINNLPNNLLPPVVPQADDGLIDNADGRLGVQVHIPGYGHAAAGDAITLLWGSEPLPEHLLTDAEVGQAPMFTLALAYASLAQAGDGTLDVRYQVRRNGQLLATSPSLKVRVFLTLPGPQDASPHTLVNEALAAPVIKGRSDNANRQDNHLDEDDYRLNADAVIAWREDFKRCDQINLFWGTATMPEVRPIHQHDLDAATDLVMCIPNTLITHEGVCKAISVRYTVTHPDNPNTSYSPTQRVKVVSQAQLPGGESGLAAPLFIQANRYNTLEPIGSPNGTTVSIKPYRNMRVGDVVTLSFSGFDAWLGGHPLAASAMTLEQSVGENEALTGCDFNIPEANLLAIPLGRAEARYSVSNRYGQATSLKADAYVDGRPPAAGCSME